MQRHWQVSFWRVAQETTQVATAVMVVETPSHQATSQAREIKLTEG